MKPKYLLVVKSITYAQRITTILKNAGFYVNMSRTPRVLGEKSCTYSVIINVNSINNARNLLQNMSFPTIKLYKFTGREYTYLGEFL